jgi:tetrapyrrole methylase family protein/MazG family protein
MSQEFDRLVEIVRRLRAPGGCPWDREQTNRSILSCLLDEAYEFFEAVDENDPAKMREELGDILLQVVLHAQISSDSAPESGAFDIEDVARDIGDKLIRRHPHVFGDAEASSSSEGIRNWERITKSEYGEERRKDMTDDIPEALPALFRAEKMQRRVAQVGFDWSEMAPVLDKVEEEFGEFREALESGDAAHAEEELGDILFALVNVGRHAKISAENALRAATRKFEKRFRYVEDRFRELGRDMRGATLEEMDAYWEESKAGE